MKIASKATIMAFLLMVLITGVTLAATINIDGIRESIWDTAPGATDKNEDPTNNPTGDIADGVDIKSFAWTNDAANFYFLIETYDITTWRGFLFHPFVIFCLNNDNDINTGTAQPQCLTGGYDRYIRVSGPGPNLSITVYEDDFMTPISTGFANVATSGRFTEIGIDLPSMGLNSSNCGEMTASIYFDGATGNPDDIVPDDGNVILHCTPPPPPPPPSEGGQGCTPGYWKQPHHLDSWVNYSPEDDYEFTFGVNASFEKDLLGALKQGGGGENALGRHAVAALLNTSSSVDYPFTEAQVISMVQYAYFFNDIEGVKNILAAGNELGCPLN